MFRRAARPHRLAAFLAAAALLLAQAVGFAHGVVHPVAKPGALPVASAHGEHADHGGHGIGTDHDVGSLSCQALDQLSHTGGLAVPVIAWVHDAPAADGVIAPAAPVQARCARGWHARGPPSVLA